MSDRGTDFIGAKRQLDEDIEKALHRNQDKVMDYTSSQEIKWEFIPPGAPHFGGIWEAAVKSVKYHLTRVIGLHKLTYEELSTLLAQIEACVNSRPLVILSEDDSQMEALTPGHFLIGRPLTAPPVEDLSNANPIQRWRLLTKIQQQIWKRWSEEYLTSLQQRNKWFKTQENPEVGQMVLLKEDNLPPLKWVLAKITKLHPGKDNLVRVVTIRLKGNKYKEAPVHKLVPLPATANTTDPGPQGGPPRTIDVYEKAIAQFKKQQKKLVETSNADILKPKQGVTAKKAEKCNNSKNMQTPPSKQSLDPIQNIQNISHQNSKPSPSPNSPQSPSSLTDSTSSTSYEDTNRDGTTQTRRRPITRAMARGTFLTIFHVILLITSGSGIGLVNNKILKDRFEEAEKKTTPGFTILKNPAIAAKFKMTNESLSIYIYFNIVETSSFELLRVTPIPRQVENDTFIIQKIPHSLIGINHHDEKYFTTDDDNINNCKEIQERKYLCNIDVVYNNPEHSSCVFNDISKKNNHTSCEWKKVKIDGIIWKKLNTENTWLFITAYPNNAAIVCSNKREEVSLNQLGILHLHRECFLKTTKLTLRSTFMTKTQAESIFNKPMTFPDINTTTFKEIKPVILRTPTVIKSSEDIYEKTALPVPTVMMMEVMPISRTTTISISATIALAIIALILWYTKRIWISLIRRCCQRPTHIEDQPATLQPSLAQQLNEILERRSPPAIRHSMDAL
ncbi:uncharacterized protein DMENIID0001_161450 [Sergentomyia squamirostris]